MGVRAALIDDSAVVRKHLAELLRKGGVEVVCAASDPLFAWPKMEALAGGWPDVIVLDVEMPRMDGITFLRKIMAERPTPVVMCSTLTVAGCETTMQAMAAGAFAFVTKPKLGLRDFLDDGAAGLVETVRAAARANMGALRRAAARVAAAPPPPAAVPAAMAAMAETTDGVIAIGSSTGGVQTLEAILTALPRTTPGILIVQHMPPGFTRTFAERLGRLAAMEVLEACHGDRLIPGRVLIAPGGLHLRLARSGAQYVAEVTDGPLVNRHKPSVDVLFRSVARAAGRNAIGVILTGMGDDGARGLLEMRQAGARTAAQDEASSVVWGMPKEAVALGAADAVLALAEIPGWLLAGAPRRAA